jgi:hypothetical protein
MLRGWQCTSNTFSSPISVKMERSSNMIGSVCDKVWNNYSWILMSPALLLMRKRQRCRVLHVHDFTTKWNREPGCDGRFGFCCVCSLHVVIVKYST